MRQLDVVSPLVAARPSHLPQLVILASPLIALSPPPDTVVCVGSSVHVCVRAAAEEGGGRV